MAGAGLLFGHNEDPFYNPMKSRWNYQSHQLHRSKGKTIIPVDSSLESRAEPDEQPSTARAPSSNLDQFLESTTPSVPAQYLSKTRMRGWRTCDVEFRPYFTLGDLWESFKEWSAYGAGVPLVLNGCDSVVQYYVPYLSGIQIYAESAGRGLMSRQPAEDSDGDYYRDSSSDGSSDSELEGGFKYTREWLNRHHPASEVACRMDTLSLREKHVAIQEGFSSDEGGAGNSQSHLIFEFLERDPPYSREPLADKISDLSSRFPELKTLRSCDLLSASWISVAWYPIYRIPTGPTLRDLDACFLTFHSLSMPTRGNCNVSVVNLAFISESVGGLSVKLMTFNIISFECEVHALYCHALDMASCEIRILNPTFPIYLMPHECGCRLFIRCAKLCMCHDPIIKWATCI